MPRIKIHNRMLKLNKKGNMFEFWLTLISILIGICIVQNEISMDDWYIEASADGLFGGNNTSLWVICGNYILTGLIWLLSKTGIRIYWLHLIMIIFAFISNYLICIMLKEKIRRIGPYISVFYLLLSTPFIFDFLSFTVSASYFTTVGILWIWHCIQKKYRKKFYIIGYLCFIIGFSLRWECVLFGGAFIIPILFIEFVQSIYIGKLKDFLKQYIPPYIIIVLCFTLITGSQIFGLKYFEKGFYEWNLARSSVDDYDILPYEQDIAGYNNIGIGKIDYDIMRAWNVYDMQVFDEERYTSIKELNNKEVDVNNLDIITKGVKNVFSTPITWIICFVIIVSHSFDRKKLFIQLLVSLGVFFAISLFFLYRGRLIQRIEYSIVVAFLLSTLFCISDDEDFFYIFSCMNRKKKILSILVFGLFALFFKPNIGSATYDELGGKSVYGIYYNALKSEDSFGRYMASFLNKNSDCRPITYNNDIAATILNNKDNIYIDLFCYSWKMAYPLTDVNLFITGKEGLASNLAFVGQYFPALSPVQNNFIRYGVDSEEPYKSITMPNVYFIVRESEHYSRVKECDVYVKKYYNSEIQYSVTDIVEDAAVGKFLSPLDVTLYDNEMENLDISFINNYEYEGFSAIKIMDTDFLENNDIKYIQLTGQDGERYCFEEFNGNNGLFVFFDDILKSGKNYSVQLIVDNEVVKRVIALNDKLTID